MNTFYRVDVSVRSIVRGTVVGDVTKNTCVVSTLESAKFVRDLAMYFTMNEAGRFGGSKIFRNRQVNVDSGKNFNYKSFIEYIKTHDPELVERAKTFFGGDDITDPIVFFLMSKVGVSASGENMCVVQCVKVIEVVEKEILF